MKLTFLGTGTSTGVPQAGCQCPVCTSADPRDRRLRTSALLESGGRHLLIDCGPDFRQQMLDYLARHPQPAVDTPHGRFRLPRLDGVLLTHGHYDHTGGLDDLRPFCIHGPVDVFADPACAEGVRRQMPYCFAEHPYPGAPGLRLHTLEPHRPVEVAGLTVRPLTVLHGKMPILGFRIGPLAYITDMKSMPDTELPLLEGLRLLVVNALRPQPHPTHQTIEEACAFARLVRAPRTLLIHLGHKAPLHARSQAALPPGVSFAYDGLTVEP